MSLSQGRKPRPPHLIASQHGIEYDEELPHARREHDFRRLALGQEASSEGTDHGVVLLGAEGSHVEATAYRGPSAPDGAATSELAAVTVEQGDAHEGRHLLVVQPPKFGQFGHEGGCRLGPDTGHAVADEYGVGLFAAVFLGSPVIHELPPPTMSSRSCSCCSLNPCGVGRVASPNRAMTPASIRSVFARRPMALAKSRTCRGFTTAM